MVYRHSFIRIFANFRMQKVVYWLFSCNKQLGITRLPSRASALDGPSGALGALTQLHVRFRSHAALIELLINSQLDYIDEKRPPHNDFGRPFFVGITRLLHAARATRNPFGALTRVSCPKRRLCRHGQLIELEYISSNSKCKRKVPQQMLEDFSSG